MQQQSPFSGLVTRSLVTVIRVEGQLEARWGRSWLQWVGKDPEVEMSHPRCLFVKRRDGVGVGGGGGCGWKGLGVVVSFFIFLNVAVA